MRNLIASVLLVVFTSTSLAQDAPRPQEPQSTEQPSSAAPPAPNPAEPANPPDTQIPANASALSKVVKEGTPVKLMFAQSVTSRSVTAGTPVEFRVVEPVMIEGQVAIPKNARAIGYLARSESAGAVGKGGSLEIRMETIRVRGQSYKLRGAKSGKEGRATGKVVGLTILFGLSGFLMAGGRDFRIAEGTPMDAEIAEDVPLG